MCTTCNIKEMLMKRIFSSLRRKNRDGDDRQGFFASRDERQNAAGDDPWFWWPLMLPSSFD